MFFILFFLYQVNCILPDWKENTSQLYKNFDSNYTIISFTNSYRSSHYGYLLRHDKKKSYYLSLQDATLSVQDMEYLDFFYYYDGLSVVGASVLPNIYKFDNGKLTSIASIHDKAYQQCKKTCRASTYYTSNKCLGEKEQSFFIRTYLGSDYTESITYRESSTDRHGCGETKGKIYASGIFYKSYSGKENIIRIYLLSKDEEGKVYYSIKEDEGCNCNGVGGNSINGVTLLEESEISVLDYEQSLLIFTYNKDSNYFKYYHYDLNNNNIIYQGNNATLDGFEYIKIKKVGFVGPTTYLWYFGFDDHKNEIVGVVDLTRNLLVFNTNQFSGITEVQFFNDTNHGGEQLYLSVLTKNNHYKLCPFIFSSSSCTYEKDNSQLIKIAPESKNSKINNGQCLEYVIDSTYCVSKCPFFYDVEGKTCKKCDDYYYYVNPRCTKSCDSKDYILDEDTKICYNCQDNNTIFYKANCIENCSKVYAEYIQENNTCSSCKENNKYYYKEKCVEECPRGSEINEDFSFCDVCKDKGEFFKDNKCVSSCDEDENYDEDSVCFKCRDKSPEEPYKEENKCVDKCDLGYVLDKDNFKCNSCKKEGKYYEDDSKCVDRCPDTKVYDEDNICYICSERHEKEKYKQLNECVEKCGDAFGIDEDTDKYNCTICGEKKKVLLHNKTCNAKCEEHAINKNWTCKYCGEEGEKYYEEFGDGIDKNASCVEKCTYGKEPKKEDVITWCKNCTEFNETYLDGVCGECKGDENNGLGILKDNTTYLSFCVNCLKEGKKSYHNQCMEKCGNDSIARITGYCYICREHGQLKEGNFCVNNCTKKYSEIREGVCICCKDEGKYYDGKCISECSAGSIIIDEVECINCKNKGKFYYHNNCTDECPSTTYTNKESICIECLCFNDGTCSPENNTCKCKDSDEYNYIGHSCEGEAENKEITIGILNQDNLILKSKRNCFNYQIKKTINDYNLTWSLFFGDDLQENDKMFYTGIHEDIFCIAEDVLRENSIIRINLSDNGKEYSASMKLSIEEIDQSDFKFVVLYGGCGPYWTNEEKVIRFKENDFGINTNYSFQIFYRDDFSDIIPLTRKNRTNKLHQVLFPTTTLIGKFFTDRGESVTNTLTDCIFYDIRDSPGIKDILNFPSSNFTNITKIFFLMNYFRVENSERQDDPTLDKEMTRMIVDFVSEIFNKIPEVGGIAEEKPNPNVQYFMGYIEPRTIFSLFNLILKKTKTMNDEEEVLTIITEAVLNMSERINTFHTSESDIKPEEFKSFFKTIDFLLQRWTFKDSKNSNEFYKNISLILNNYSNFLSRLTVPFQDLKISGENASIHITHLGRGISSLALFKQENSKDYIFDKFPDKNKTSFPNNLEKMPSGSFFYINHQSIQNLNAQAVLSNSSISDIAISLIEFNKTKEQKETLVNVYNVKTNKIYQQDEIKKTLLYEIAIPIPVVFKSKNDTKIDNQNKSCYSDALYNGDSELFCYTHFIKEKDQEPKAICKCNIIGNLTVTENNNITNISKKMQFPKTVYTRFNFLSVPFFYTTLFLVFLPAIFLLLKDICLDNNLLNNAVKQTQEEKQNEVYTHLSHLAGSSIFSFSWYLTIINYPFLNMISFYHFSAPIYIKYMINFIGALIAFIIPCIPYINKPFPEREKFIDERNYEHSDNKIHNIYPNLKKVTITFCITMAVSLVVKMIVTVIELKMEHKAVEQKKWKEDYTLMKDYVDEKVKKELLLPESWKLIKNKILAFNFICGKVMIKKLNLTRDDKFKKYSDYKRKQIDSFGGLSKIIEKKKESIDSEDYDGYGKGIQSRKGSSIFEISQLKIPQDKYNPEDLSMTNQSNFSLLNGQNLGIGKILKKFEKFERIRNKYIFVRNEGDESEIDEVSKNLKVANLELSKTESITYLGSLKVPSIPNKNERNILKNRIITFILCIILILLYAFFFYVSKTLFDTYEYNIVWSWILPAITELVVGNFIFCYIGNLFIVLFMFKKYSKRKINWFVGLFFKLFVQKYVVYLVKIRNYITKYELQFKYRERNSYGAVNFSQYKY